jgi:hypothetical protein
MQLRADIYFLPPCTLDLFPAAGFAGGFAELAGVEFLLGWERAVADGGSSVRNEVFSSLAQRVSCSIERAGMSSMLGLREGAPL